VARILFTTFGSYGDLHPYMAVAAEMQARGHRVTIGTSAAYRAKVESEGIAFHAVRPDVSLDDTALLHYVFDPKKGSERVVRMVISAVRESWEDTAPAAAEADAIVTHPLTFAAVMAAQKLGLPWISSVLAPISFISAYDPPVVAPAPWLARLRALGPGFMKRIWDVGRREARKWAGPLLAFRRQLGLSDSENPIFEGSHSPDLVLALFSKALAEPQPDWPRHTVTTGFPFFDRHHERPDLPPEVERFLADGPPPLVFTLGSSAVATAGDFYRESLEAVERLGARAVFLTGGRAQGLPETLPEGIIAGEYAAHSSLFPRASAIVHQGGVGTTAQAMRSGRPMLVVPFAHDQYDNAARVQRQGAAEVLYRNRYNGARAAQRLARLLRDPAYEAAAQRLGKRVRSENGAAAAAEAIERFLQF
jgi:MGT family glycosyltransferase